uniref:LIM zinc-binding domain-containing protein n=1 Tax=Zea mays TaxID=4577 RepID=C0PIM3_MAIZE|nr:unknown [Zea mays]
MATSFQGTTTKCTACDKTVYLVDKLTADNRIYHKACFRCHHCKGTLKVPRPACFICKAETSIGLCVRLRMYVLRRSSPTTTPSRECSTAGLTSTSCSRGQGAWTRASKVSSFSPLPFAVRNRSSGVLACLLTYKWLQELRRLSSQKETLGMRYMQRLNIHVFMCFSQCLQSLHFFPSLFQSRVAQETNTFNH